MKRAAELAILECFDRLLKPAPSSKMLMLAKIAANNGLDAKFLPGYAVDAAPDAAGESSMPTKAITALIKEHAIASTARAFNLALEAHGLLRVMRRKNSKQETVEFWSKSAARFRMRPIVARNNEEPPMDNQHKKITGYRDLSQSEIDGMNSIKALEVDAGELFKKIGSIDGVDPRLLALAKTNLQQGFMWFVRSIAKPADPFN